MNKNIKAVTIGDIEGIGIQLLIRLWKFKRKKIGKFFLISNFLLLKKYLKRNKINASITKISDLSNLNKTLNSSIPIYDISADNDISNSYKSIITGYKLNKKPMCSSLITLPINKEKIIKKINKNFTGHTELLQKLDKKKYSNMIFYSKKIIITTLTTHIPLRKINYYLKNKDIITKKIISLNELLKIDFNISNPKIAIAGLNPHAGENGNIGYEEVKILNPIIKKIQKKGIDIEGPFSPDSIFNKINIKKFDCFICIYHDQALIPFKLIDTNGTNFTGSLSIIRVSPAHGTAYNLVNTNKFNDKSLENSFIIADKIFKNRLRKKFAKT